MNAEGIAREITPELVRALATAIPIALAGWWILRLLGGLWRSAIWEQIGGALETLSSELGGEIAPLWTGWRLRTPSVRIDWVGGVQGMRTRIVRDGDVQWHGRLLTSGEVRPLLHRDEHGR